MRTLHILNKLSEDHPANRDCFAVLGDDDGLMLIEDAVYLSQKGNITNTCQHIYCLQHDLHTRGLSPKSNAIKIINDADFVELFAQYEKSISWY